MTEDEEILEAFLEESRENLDQMARDLVDLEADPHDAALLARVFRAVHTVKGTCGFLGFRHLEALSHAGENLLGALRDGDLILAADTTTTLLVLVDTITSVLDRVAATGTEGEADHADVIARLSRHLDPAGASVPSPTATPSPATVVISPPPTAPVSDPLYGPDGAGSPAETSIRVDVSVLDKLQDLVGELVLARDQIGEVAQADEDGPLTQPYRQLRLITSELREGVMRARLQPVGAVLGRFHRIGRDLAAALGKHVAVEVEGEDVGVDKAINEALRDPLLHLVRNAIDHGIESPAERLAGGKSALARLHIRASHERGRLQVEVADDGRGIDVEALSARALALGLVTAEQLAAAGTTERLELIFVPGLSTKGGVTTVSGRGVGMDVVRTDLEQVGGTIEVSTEAGRGTIFRINVPLTLAIVGALIVRCGAGRYAIPQVDVQEVVHVESDRLGLAVPGSTTAPATTTMPVLRLRGHLVPVVDLAAQLDLPRFLAELTGCGDSVLGSGRGRGSGGGAGWTDAGRVVVVLRTGGRRFGLLVDEVGDTTEAVVKPLTRALRAVPVYAGVTLLGDGRPALILDVAGLATAAGIVDERDQPVPDVLDLSTTAASTTAADSGADLLLATGTDGGRVAIPLDVVRRVEHIPAGRIERMGPGEVVLHDGGILPLVRAAASIDSVPDQVAWGDDGAEDARHAVVCASSVGLVGVLVRDIDDVVAGPPRGGRPATRGGVSTYVVLVGRVTEVLDIEALVAEADLRSPV